MKTNTNTTQLNDILHNVIRKDAALTGYTPTTLPTAAKARIQNTLVSLEQHLTSEDLDQLEVWTGGASIFTQAEATFREGGCCYYVFADGSLYFSSTGDSEVWGLAEDFASEKIINGYEGKLDEMDEGLLKHLGGHYAEEISNRQ